MKSTLKYFVSALFCLSAGIGFMPVLQITVVKISMIDIFKLQFKAGERLGIFQEAGEIFEEYIENYILLINTLLFVVLFSAVLMLVIPTCQTYYLAIVLSAVINVLVGILWFSVKSKIDNFKEAIIFFSLGKSVNLCYSTAFLWIVLYLLILVLSIVGIVLTRNEEMQEQESDGIMIENCNIGGNPWQYRQEFTEVQRNQLHTDRLRQIEHRQTSDNMSAVQGQDNARTEDKRKFFGAIEGKYGNYSSKIYPLEEKRQIFFVNDNDKIFISKQMEYEVLTGIYYIEEYKEYCLNVLKKNKVFLNSGQPLGQNRTYYLPRGTEIYLQDREYSFRLS